ncbi:MAG: PIN domain-containing protein [Actinomycetota bacterium]
MIYLDTSVVLAELLSEDRKPPPEIWSATLLSSRLLEYETWVRLNSYSAATTHEEAARHLLAKVSYIELAPQVLERAMEPFPRPVRTLDALHMSSLLFIRSLHLKIELAAYDERLRDLAADMKIPLVPNL